MVPHESRECFGEGVPAQIAGTYRFPGNMQLSQPDLLSVEIPATTTTMEMEMEPVRNRPIAPSMDRSKGLNQRFVRIDEVIIIRLRAHSL